MCAHRLAASQQLLALHHASVVMSGKGCQPCGAKWACPGLGKASPCRRTTADGTNPVVMMFPEDLRCFACDAPKPVDSKQIKLEAFVKQNPEMAHLLTNGSGKASGKGGPKGKGDKGNGKGGKDTAQGKGKGKGKGGKSEPAGKGNGKGDKGGKHLRGTNFP